MMMQLIERIALLEERVREIESYVEWCEECADSDDVIEVVLEPSDSAN